MKTTKTTCNHDVRVRGEQKVCTACKTVVGTICTATHAIGDTRRLLNRAGEEYAVLKAKFLEVAAKDPSNAIRLMGYELLVLQHQAELANGIQRELDAAQTLADKKELIRDLRAAFLKKHMGHRSVFDWDSSKLSFAHEVEKSRSVAGVKILETLDETGWYFDRFVADLALPMVV